MRVISSQVKAHHVHLLLVITRLSASLYISPKLCISFHQRRGRGGGGGDGVAGKEACDSSVHEVFAL